MIRAKQGSPCRRPDATRPSRLGLLIALLAVAFPLCVQRTTVSAGGAKEDWALEHVELLQHAEAELLVRHGSINNLGFGWPQGFDPFSGASTPVHPYPWQPNPKAAQGTDRILVVSSYRGNPPAGRDGYTNSTTRPANFPVPIPITFTPPKFPIQSAVLQVFVDDFQAPVWKSRFFAMMNGWRVPEFEAILNSLNQTGPIGKLVTYQLPAEVVNTLHTGKLIILIDDPITGAGDGYAFDFFRLLINPRGSKYRGTLTGRVTDAATGKPVAGATVSAGGVVTAQTALDGTYKLNGVPAGLAIVMFSGKGYQRMTRTVDLLAGKTQQVEARLNAVKLEVFLKEEAAFQPRRVVPLHEAITETTEKKDKRIREYLLPNPSQTKGADHAPPLGKKAPDAPPVPRGVEEDFRKVEVGALPAGWTAGARRLRVQVDGERHQLELAGKMAGVEFAQLPPIPLQGDFFVELAFILRDRKTSLALQLAAEQPALNVITNGEGVTFLQTPRGAMQYDVSKALKARGQENLLRLERKDAAYLLTLNKNQVAMVSTALSPGPFTTVRLGLGIAEKGLRSPVIRQIRVVPVDNGEGK